MQITVDIPDEFVSRVLIEGRDAPDTALESLGIEAYRTGRLSQYELQQFLGLSSRFEVEQLLKDHSVSEGAYYINDWLADEATAKQIDHALSTNAK